MKRPTVVNPRDDFDTSKYPTARRPLLWFLWNNGLTTVDLLKAGTCWVALVGPGRQHNVHVNSLSSLTYQQWFDKMSELVAKEKEPSHGS